MRKIWILLFLAPCGLSTLNIVVSILYLAGSCEVSEPLLLSHLELLFYLSCIYFTVICRYVIFLCSLLHIL
jgi:hypothetical protein